MEETNEKAPEGMKNGIMTSEAWAKMPLESALQESAN
jgi:hypothetical protein